MRLLLTSDWHLDAVTLGHPRRAELIAYLKGLCRAVRDEDIDVVAFGGDLADPGSMLGCQYEADAIAWFWELAAASNLGTMLAIAGNHDVVEVARPLTTLEPVKQAARLESASSMHVVVADEPMVAQVRSTSANSNVGFLLLPYVSRAWSDREKRGDGFIGPEQLLEHALQSADLMRQGGSDIVVIGHRTVPDARIGSESVEMSRGRDLDLPLERIAALRPAYVFNGHYHRPQVVRTHGMEIHIPGSPLSYTVDDPAAGKGYIVAEV